MFSNLTSLTGGGGLSASSSASADGDVSSSDVFNGGGVTFGNNQKTDKNVVYAGIAAVTFLGFIWVATRGKA